MRYLVLVILNLIEVKFIGIELIICVGLVITVLMFWLRFSLFYILCTRYYQFGVMIINFPLYEFRSLSVW